MPLTILLFIFLLGLLVLVHEWGHFIVARKFGVRVEEFAFGFPPRLASFTRRGTRYALNLVPIGGYVKIFGESGEAKDNEESFGSRPLWQRAAIVAAGAAMNLVLAWVLFSVGHAAGFPTMVSDGERVQDIRVTVVAVAPGSPAEAAGLRFGDVLDELRAGSAKVPIDAIERVQEFINAERGGEITLVVLRGRERLELNASLRREPPAEEGPLGIAMAEVGIVRSPWWRAPWDGLKTTASAVVALVRALGHVLGELVGEGRVSGDIMGPLGIVAFAVDTRQLGFVYLIEFVGVLSVNLAIINVLPIPALDGGRLAFLLLERLRGSHVNQRAEWFAHTVGFVVLMALIAVITYRDVVRIF